jgi:hypothetical protein
VARRAIPLGLLRCMRLETEAFIPDGAVVVKGCLSRGHRGGWVLRHGHGSARLVACKATTLLLSFDADGSRLPDAFETRLARRVEAHLRGDPSDGDARESGLAPPKHVGKLRIDPDEPSWASPPNAGRGAESGIGASLPFSKGGVIRTRKLGVAHSKKRRSRSEDTVRSPSPDGNAGAPELSVVFGVAAFGAC